MAMLTERPLTAHHPFVAHRLMRRLCPLFFALTLIFLGCGTVDDPPECDFEPETTCTCSDGTEGVLVCVDGLASCICERDSWDGD